MAEWISEYGVWAVFAGGLFEGEAVFIAAGYAVSQGYVAAGPALLAAVLGATLGDHAWYLAGRLWGVPLLRRVPAFRRVHGRAVLWVRRWGRGAAFGLRFAYGLRSVLPLSLGAARFPPALFVPLNALGAAAFSLVYLSLGYFFGEAAERLFVRVRAFAPQVVVAVVVIGLVVWAIREWSLFHGRSAARPDAPDGDP